MNPTSIAVVGILIILDLRDEYNSASPSPFASTFPFLTLMTYSVGLNFLYLIAMISPPSCSNELLYFLLRVILSF